MAKSKFYVVWKGRRTGVFTTWAEAEAQVKGFAGAEFKSFESRAEADAAYKGRYVDYKGKAEPAPVQQRLVSGPPPILESLSVDAACAGVPGPVEFRGVRTGTGEEVFRFGPFPNGTNNIGEFLAIVHALRLLHDQNSPLPVYSDSVNAIGWVRAKKCRTNHARVPSNERLFRLIDEAEAWLNTNTYPNKVLKWETDQWGENPADFGRK